MPYQADDLVYEMRASSNGANISWWIGIYNDAPYVPGDPPAEFLSLRCESVWGLEGGLKCLHAAWRAQEWTSRGLGKKVLWSYLTMCSAA
jgi:hypothetical protein